MSQNVYEKVEGERPALMDAIGRNSQVASAIMGYLNLFCGLCVKFGHAVDAIEVSGLAETARRGEFRARVSFGEGGNMRRLWSPQSDFGRYVRAKGQFMAMMLDQNPAIEKFFDNMINVLSLWARDRGIKFEDLEIKDPIVTKDFVLTFKVKSGVLIAVH